MENAIKYSPEGSKVVVEVTATNQEVQVAVCDQGDGIPSDEMQDLFKPFYRGNHQTKRKNGAGLGLYIAKKLIEAQNGQIWVESHPNCGSRFTFTLPQITMGD